MQVRDGMSKMVLTVGPGHTLREAARLDGRAPRRRGGRARPRRPGPGIITERDILESVGRARTRTPSASRDHLTSEHRLRRARLVAGGGGGRDGPRRLPPPGRDRRRRGRRHALDARHRPLLDRGRRDLRRARSRRRGGALPARLEPAPLERGAQSRSARAGARRSRGACRAIQRDDRARWRARRRRRRRATSDVVTPTSATVMPTVSRSGWMLGPGGGSPRRRAGSRALERAHET